MASPRRVINLDDLERVEASGWPRITVVTPCYNRPDYLEEAILSVLDQDYPNLEYIVADGGSTDPGVFEIIRRHEDRLAWWISERDSGHGEAIKKGFERSSGDILAWLCSDDRYEPGALRAVGKAFALCPDADVVYGNAYGINEDSAIIHEIRSVPYARLALFSGMNFHQTSVFWRRELYDRVGGMNLEYAHYATDHELFFRFVNAGARFVFLRAFLSAYRYHPGQTTVAGSDGVSEYAWRAMRREFPFWSRPRVYRALRLVMRVRSILWHILLGETDYVARNLHRRLVGRGASPSGTPS